MQIFLPSIEPLFQSRQLSTLIKDHLGRIENLIEELSDDNLLATPTQDLIDNILEKTRVPPLRLYRTHGVSHDPRAINRYIDHTGTERLIDAFVFEVEFPYTGATGLFNHSPATRDLDPPKARFSGSGYEGTVVITVAGVDVTEDILKAEIEKELNKIDKYISYQALQLDPFNSSISDRARELIETRKNKILRARKIAASLGYPMHPRPDAPLTYVSPVVRRKLPVRLLPREGFKPEPSMEETDYQNILAIITSMTFVMERSPSVFSKMPEEVLRDHYLVQLNAQYESATGETFNAHGKTDILVRDGGANIFIAECKIWRGPQSITDALNQLFSYLTWRDTKAALIVFSRNKDFSHVLETIWPTMAAHPQLKRGPGSEGETRMRYVFGRPDDANREIFLTVLVFNMPDDELYA